MKNLFSQERTPDLNVDTYFSPLKKLARNYFCVDVLILFPSCQWFTIRYDSINVAEHFLSKQSTVCIFCSWWWIKLYCRNVLWILKQFRWLLFSCWMYSAPESLVHPNHERDNSSFSEKNFVTRTRTQKLMKVWF